MGSPRHRIRTRKAEIARYWSDTRAGLERLPENCAIGGELEPCCFACGFDAVRCDVSSEGWDGWETAALDRCHLVPRALGGDESPSNLVLLCRPCHRDAPNVGDPSYMLRGITERESWFEHMWTFIRSAFERADLRSTVNTFSRAELDESDRVLRDLLRRWTGSHRGYVTDASLEA
jgi:5-methylcytosine-specific restriction endonuclease McrA